MAIRDDLEYPTEYGAQPPQGKWATTVQPVFIVGGRSHARIEADEPADEIAVVTLAGEEASRHGLGVCGWINEKTPLAAQIVLTDGGLIYNIPSGYRVMVAQYCYAVETTSDDCQFEFGYTDQANGAGTFTPVGPHKHVFTGAANTGRTAYDQDISPAARISYAAGARCITFRVDANDATCQITVGWHGWIEAE